jgi:hypothetical protein
MKIKEKVIHDTIFRINKRILKIDGILDASPLIDIIELKKEAQILLKEHKTVEQRTSIVFTDKLSQMAKKEKELFALAKYQSKNTLKLIQEKAKIQNELYDLSNELYWINQKKNRKLI